MNMVKRSRSYPVYTDEADLTSIIFIFRINVRIIFHFLSIFFILLIGVVNTYSNSRTSQNTAAMIKIRSTVSTFLFSSTYPHLSQNIYVAFNFCKRCSWFLLYCIWKREARRPFAQSRFYIRSVPALLFLSPMSFLSRPYSFCTWHILICVINCFLRLFSALRGDGKKEEHRSSFNKYVMNTVKSVTYPPGSGYTLLFAYLRECIHLPDRFYVCMYIHISGIIFFS